jgi:hypothetical protein
MSTLDPDAAGRERPLLKDQPAAPKEWLRLANYGSL